MPVTSEQPDVSGGRPAGVVVICVLYSLFAMVALIGGLLLLGLGSVSFHFQPHLGFYVLVSVFFLVATVSLVVVYGLWTFTEWGWVGGLVLAGLGGVSSVSDALTGDVESIAYLVVCGLIVWYLWDRRAYFRGGIGTAESTTPA